MGPRFRGDDRREGSPLAERAHQLVVQRLDQVGEHGAVAGLHEGFDRHAGYQLDVAETGDFCHRQRNADRVIALPGAWSVVTSGEARVTTPFSSGVVRWLNADSRSSVFWPICNLSMSCGLTLASTERASACGTIIMMASPAVITPPTVWTGDCRTLPSCGARMATRPNWSSAVPFRSTNSPILSFFPPTPCVN